eukprot:Rmarinus@m.18741
MNSFILSTTAGRRYAPVALCRPYKHRARRGPQNYLPLPNRPFRCLSNHPASGAPFEQGNYADAAWKALSDAVDISESNGQGSVESEHLFLSLLKQEDGFVCLVLEACKPQVGIKDIIRKALDALQLKPQIFLGQGGKLRSVLSPNLVRLLRTADEFRKEDNSTVIEIEHLLLAFCRDPRFGKQLFHKLGVNKEALQAAISAIREELPTLGRGGKGSGRLDALKKFARNLTEEAIAGNLDPVIGRQEEMRRCIQVLSRRIKNNPMLTGEPGTGKTAVVEGLAQRIASGDVPQGLRNKQIFMLDMGSLVAGTKYRGEFEDRLKAIGEEAASPDIILFIDEAHTIIGAGATSGALDAGNILKPMLGRGQLRCIGATTLDEYRKYFEKDPALERRFQPITIQEPSVEETIAILRGLKPKYEVHHGVRIKDGALVAAAGLSHRYITSRFLPDKAIDVVDEAAAKLQADNTSKPEVVDTAERRVVLLEMERLSVESDVKKSSADATVLQRIDEDLKLARKKKDEVTDQWKEEKDLIETVELLNKEKDKVEKQIRVYEREYDLEKAAELKFGKLPNILKDLESAEHTWDAHKETKGSMLREEVTEDDVREILSRSTGIPVTKLVASEKDRLLHLSDEIHGRVIGQHSAVDAVVSAIQRARAGLTSHNRPTASFLFLGPTGVGKTELTKAVTECLFDEEDAMIRIDMSEYMEKSSVSRLLGAPPGYVGYESGGQLTEQVRRRPFSVVLFDELEKAHPDVFNVLLQVLDDGRVTDSHGRTVDFRNTIIVMTSNVGSHHLVDCKGKIDDNTRDLVDKELRLTFRPEFLNRIDDVILFELLNRDEVKEIARLQLRQTRTRLYEQGVGLVVSDTAVDALAEIGFEENYGARPLRRAIIRHVDNEIAHHLLAGRLQEGDCVHVDTTEDGDIIVTPTRD